MLVTAVVPVLDGMQFLPRTVPTLLAAARRSGCVELIYVDNGSRDGSYEYLQSLAADTAGTVRVVRREGVSIGALRNAGARCGCGEYISFLDADCGVGESYFDEAVSVLRATGAAATGCEVHAPEPPHWIEGALHDLHYVGRDRDVHYINSANFFVSRAAFDDVGGFREDLRTGEDAEIGQRLLAGGHRIRESTRVVAIHYGNPKSVREFYRRTVWHGLGMLATVTRRKLDKPVMMMTLHLVATAAGVVLLFDTTIPLLLRLLIAVGLQLVVPIATVAHRIGQTRRVGSPAAALVLYWLYYWARLQAFALVASGRADGYRKK